MHPLTVLVIDDMRSAHDTATLAARLLARELDVPITTLTAYSGIEGAQLLRAHADIHLVILDVHLPGSDVDGRLIGALTRELHPAARILPFTGDRDPATAADLQALGMEPPAIKPIAPKDLAVRMRQLLDQPASGEPAPLQNFLASHTRKMVQLLEHGAATRLPAVALLAHDHLVRAGLTHILQEVRQELSFTLVNQGGTAETLSVELQRGETRLVICIPEELRTAEELAAPFHVPLLVYASIDSTVEALARPWSLVVGPTATAELVDAIQQTLAGACYRTPDIAAVVGLNERQHTIIQSITQGATNTQIAAAIGVSEHWVRHLISALYEQLGLPPSRAALLNWAKHAPLHLLEERHWS